MVLTRTLVSVDDERINFWHGDPIEGTLCEVMALVAAALIRRFFLHVLPRGFVRIRHSGLLASRRKAVDLARCRNLFGVAEIPETTEPLPVPTTAERIFQLHRTRYHHVPALWPAVLPRGIGGAPVGRPRLPARAGDPGFVVVQTLVFDPIRFVRTARSCGYPAPIRDCDRPCRTSRVRSLRALRRSCRPRGGREDESPGPRPTRSTSRVPFQGHAGQMQSP
jgi:hypothetical protein